VAVKVRVLVVVLAALAVAPASAAASWIGLYSHDPHYVEIVYRAEEGVASDVTINASDDGSVVYVTDTGANMQPLPPSDTSYQPCLVVDVHHAICRYIGPPNPANAYVVDHSSISVEMGQIGPDRVRVLRGGAPLEVTAFGFDALDVDVPESVRTLVYGGRGDMNVRVGTEHMDGGYVSLGWGKNRAFTYNHAVDDIYCSTVASPDQSLFVDANDNVQASCSGVFRFP
jgi:hypothetical protein